MCRIFFLEVERQKVRGDGEFVFGGEVSIKQLLIVWSRTTYLKKE
jgi:hypothetical protein